MSQTTRIDPTKTTKGTRSAPTRPVAVDVVRTGRDRAAYTAVLAEQRRWLERAVGCSIGELQPGAELEYADPFAAYTASRTVALLASVDGRPVGIVALAPLQQAPETVELKRMYVRASARGAGVGRRLATAAIELARTEGWQRVVLDTHPPSMAAARRLYLSLGFQQVSALGLARADGVQSLALDLPDTTP